MRELNEFNKILMRTFTSKQAYQQIKGHYIPITLDNVSDESAKDLEKRKYYIANYQLIMKGLLIDEDEFEISPAISRQVTMFEVDTKNKGRRVDIEPARPNVFDLDFTFVVGNTELSEKFRYDADIYFEDIDNLINCYDVMYSSTTNNTLTYTNCAGTVTTVATTSGDSGNICVKSTTSPSFAASSGGTLTYGDSCASSFSVYINSNYLGDNLDKVQINNGDILKIVVYKLDSSAVSTIKSKVVLV